MESYFYNEINKAKKLIKSKSLGSAFYHLERAHIIGQKSVKLHTIAHLYMLWIGVIERDFKEVIGQIIRIPLGIIGSAIGIIPTGNTGKSNVSIFAKLEIPEDIKKIIK